MTDTRNWKCFFGMHQWEERSAFNNDYYHNYSGSGLPYKTTIKYVLKCCHCGTIKAIEV